MQSRWALRFCALLLFVLDVAAKPEYAQSGHQHPSVDLAKCPLASQCPRLRELKEEGIDLEAYLESQSLDEWKATCPFLAKYKDDVQSELKQNKRTGCPYLDAHPDAQDPVDISSAAHCPLASQCPKIRELAAQGVDIKEYLKQYKFSDLEHACPYLAGRQDKLLEELGHGDSKCPYLAVQAHSKLHSKGSGSVKAPKGLENVLNQLPLVKSLNAQKKAFRAKKSSLSHDLFVILFPFLSPAYNSLLATFYISSIPNFLLMLVPANIDMRSLNTLVAFATGGLLGDCFFHLLPQTFLGEHQDDNVHFVMVEERRNIILGVAMFIGFALFVIIGRSAERVPPWVLVERSLPDKSMRIFAGPEGAHSHVASETVKDEDDSVVLAATSTETATTPSKYNLRQRNGRSPARSRSASPSKGHRVASPAPKKTSQSIKLSAYLNLVADFVHNSTDGLAIAASFYLSPTVGAATSLGVFLHEVPHELGDSALLIKGGFTRRAAMLSQFVTASGAFLGVLIGIWIQERGLAVDSIEANAVNSGLFGSSATFADLVIPFTAGGFLYVACLGAIPELLDNVTGDKKKDLVQFSKELLALAGGMAIMLAIGKYCHSRYHAYLSSLERSMSLVPETVQL